jgi:hypothetical protein
MGSKRPNPKTGGGKGRHPQAAANAAEIEERRRQVATLLLSGGTYAQIGRAVGVSAGQVAKDVKAIRQEWKEERAEKYDELVDEECKRLNALLGRYWAQAYNGDRHAADLCLKIIAQRAKILGLGYNQPQVEVNVNVYDPLEELERSFRSVLAARGLLGVVEEQDAGTAEVVGERLALPLPAEPVTTGEGSER